MGRLRCADRSGGGGHGAAVRRGTRPPTARGQHTPPTATSSYNIKSNIFYINITFITILMPRRFFTIIQIFSRLLVTVFYVFICDVFTHQFQCVPYCALQFCMFCPSTSSFIINANIFNIASYYVFLSCHRGGL